MQKSNNEYNKNSENPLKHQIKLIKSINPIRSLFKLQKPAI